MLLSLHGCRTYSLHIAWLYAEVLAHYLFKPQSQEMYTRGFKTVLSVVGPGCLQLQCMPGQAHELYLWIRLTLGFSSLCVISWCHISRPAHPVLKSIIRTSSEIVQGQCFPMGPCNPQQDHQHPFATMQASLCCCFLSKRFGHKH